MFERVSDYFANFAAVILKTRTETNRKNVRFDNHKQSKN